jgi:uncharacterized protein
MRWLQPSSELGEAEPIFTFRTPSRLAAAGILCAITLMTPAGASAQFEDVLRNVMQGVLQNGLRPQQPAYRAYPPTPYGGAPQSSASDPRMVAELQQMLDDLGYDAGPADGTPGAQTVQALSGFERDHGQPPTGEVSAASLSAVRSVWYEHNRGAASGSAAIGQTVPRPSFDCARAVAPSARTICGSVPLAQLDAEMAAAYVAAKAGLPAAEQTKVTIDQHEWLRGRNRCGADASCLERTLTERLGQLQTIAARAGPIGLGAAPAIQDLPPAFTPQSPAPAASATEQTGDSAAAIAALSQPRAGLRALKFPMLGGLPVFGDRNLSGEEEAFFKLVALGGRPNLLESGDGTVNQPVAANDAVNARQFANEFLTRPNKYLGQSGDWSGENEFQQDASLEAFLRDYAERLRQMAPKPPFEFVYAAELTLDRYNKRLGGFPLRGSPDLRSLRFGWLQPSPDFKWPEMFLPIDEAGAQRLLDRLQASRTSQRDNLHAVRLAAVIEAGRLDPGSLDLQLRLRRLTLYDDHLTQSLYEFPQSLYEFPAPAASARPAQNVVSRLLAPPPGVMPIRLPVLEGRPVLSRDEVSERFLTLVALGNFPDLLRERQGIDIRSIRWSELSLLRHFLTPDVQLQLTVGCATPDPVPSDLRRCGGEWKGADEFARERSRQSFEQYYLPKLEEFAPKGPFEFAYPAMVQLPEYDTKRGGFALGKGGFDQDFGHSTILGSMKWTPEFEPPDLFWSLDTTNAERLLHQLQQAAARQQALGHSTNDRMVQVVLVGEASRLEPDPDRTALRLKAVHLYTQDLGTKLYTFPGIGPEPEAYLTSAIPAKLAVPGPAQLDAFMLGLKYIEALGDNAPDTVYAALWQLIATRDETFYAQPNPWAGLPANDARRPFFPSKGAEQTQPATDAFQKWVKAYAAGLPATAVSATAGVSQEQKDGSHIVEALQGGSVVGAEIYGKFLAESHLQADQLVSISSSALSSLYLGGATVPILFAMPNRWSLYTFKIPKQVFERHPGASPVSVSTFKLGAARLASNVYGQNVLVIDLTPLSTKISAGNETLAGRTYDDIPPLNGLTFTSSSPQAEKPVSGSAFELDSTLLDLLAAKAVAERLTPKALSDLIERRWMAENKGSAAGGRFFALGKRQPTPDEAAMLAPSFIGWAREHSPAFPVRVTISGRVEIANDQKTAPWRAVPCLLTTREPVQGVLDWSRTAVVNATRDKAYKIKAGAGWTQGDEEQLAAIEFFAGASQSFYLGGSPSGGCGIAPPNFSSPDPAFFALRIPHSLPTPNVSVLAGKQQLDLTATLDLNSIAYSQSPPSLAELLPPELAKAPAIPQFQSGTPAGEFVTFDMTFLEARWSDPGGKEVARLGSEQGDDLDGLVKRYQQRLAKLAADTATPSGPYGLDLVGVRLGMSFEDAEQAIRDHMKVGRVLQGRRVFDPAEKSGLIKPLDSGELFLSTDENDAIAILDEPPAAKGRVMAAWRRVLTPEGSAPQANIVIQIEKKYGKPGNFDSDPVKAPYFPTPLSWYRLTGSACTGLYDGWNDRSEPISKTWYQDGRPMTAPLAYILQLKAPPMPDPLLDPLDEQSKRWAQCGPFMEMYLLGGPGAHAKGAPDELDMTLTDIGPYLKAYQESRATLQAAPAAPMALFEGPYGPDVVGVRLGMTLDEAQSAIGGHMKVAGTFRITSASQAGDSGGLPGSGLLFVSESNDEVIAVFDAPHPGEGHVAAVWRRVYSPQAVDLALVTRRATEKYGTLTSQGDAGRLLVWGSGPPMVCGASDGQIFEARTPVEAYGLDAAATAFQFHATDGETTLTAPMINAPASHVDLASASGDACGPRLRVDFQPDQGDPPMNVTETMLTDPNLASRVSQVLHVAAPRAAVKF